MILIKFGENHMKTLKNKNKSLFNEKNSKLKASDNMFEVGEKIVSDKNLLPNVLTENEAVDKELEEAKQWYMDAVESDLILRGKSRKEAKALIKKSKFREKLNKLPEVCLRYNVKDTADEICETYEHGQNNTDLEEAKQWYMDAVESNLILRGMTRKEAKVLIRKAKLKKLLDMFPELQMHYSIEGTADDIIEDFAKK